MTRKMDRTANEGFATRLKQAMRARGLISTRTNSGVNLGELRQAAGVSFEMARQYAEGISTPRHDIITKISEWLNVSSAWLAWGEGSMEPRRDNIDREELKRCFAAVRAAQEETFQELTDDQEIELALYLYAHPEDKPSAKLNELIQMWVRMK